MSVWDTDLGRWRLAWDAYLAGPQAVADPLPEPVPPDPDEVCDDEVEANAAAGHLPAPLLAYAESGGVA